MRSFSLKDILRVLLTFYFKNIKLELILTEKIKFIDYKLKRKVSRYRHHANKDEELEFDCAYDIFRMRIHQ